MFNQTEARLLQPIKKTQAGCQSHNSKGNDSRCDTEGDLSESKTLDALEILKEENFTQNWNAYCMYNQPN